MSDQAKTRKRTLEGVVVSDKMDKTVVVAVQRLTPHPLYGRVMRRTAKYKAHDEANDCHQGDRVAIQECRPLSKDKCWRVIAVLERAR
ncbi:MAG: 30S ribosomal protein S17 [Armatimonadetes bacterium]|nr:30S ribosomal protein S17 [Armatimonadota bacterium]